MGGTCLSFGLGTQQLLSFIIFFQNMLVNLYFYESGDKRRVVIDAAPQAE
jgi:hypothetical protein